MDDLLPRNLNYLFQNVFLDTPVYLKFLCQIDRLSQTEAKTEKSSFPLSSYSNY